MNLVLVESSSYYPTLDDVKVCDIYKPVGRWLRLLRYIHHRTGLFRSLRSIWLGDWKRELGMFQNVAIFDSLLDDYPLLLLNQCNKHVFFCFRNRVQNPIAHSKLVRDPRMIKEKYKCELWSYNKEDCDYYTMNYYKQFHLIPREDVYIGSEIESDAFFIGWDKGRMPIILDIYRKLCDLNLICDFRVIAESESYSDEEKKLLSETISYKEVLQKVKSSRCVIDVVSDINRGLTYRSLEAAIFKKKLITNYSEIVNMDFYRPNNIFVWGKDNPNRLRDFIYTEYLETDSDIYKDYSFDSFCCSIFGKKEFKTGYNE